MITFTFDVCAFPSGCNKNQLTDGTALPDHGVHCGFPLLTAGIRNGLVCYTGTAIGATAIHHCFNHGSFEVNSSWTSVTGVRTCLPDGTWNGTVPHCEHSEYRYMQLCSFDVIKPIVYLLYTLSANTTICTGGLNSKKKLIQCKQVATPRSIPQSQLKWT